MSAWRIGAESSAGAPDRGVAFGPEDGATPTDAAGVIDRLTKWIPGDALALYVASVTAFAASDGAEPSPLLLVVFIVLSAAFVVGSAFASSGEVPSTVLLPAILAAVAFTIWTLSVPFSGWNRWDLVADNQAGVAIVAAIAGVLFGFVAEGFTKRAQNAADRGPRP